MSQQGQRRWSAEQALAVAAGIVTILGFGIDRIAEGNKLLGEPTLGGVVAGLCLLLFGLGWRYLEGKWNPPGPGRPAPSPPLRQFVDPYGTSGTVAGPDWIIDKLRNVTGETLVREALSPAGWYPFGKPLPMENMPELMLAEVALLRRLTMYPATRPLRKSKCINILRAGGIPDPDNSLARLDGRILISEPNHDQFTLTGTGNQVAHDFSICLMHDPILVAAYHKVTLAINQTTRVDGQPVTDASVPYDAWLRPPPN